MGSDITADPAELDVRKDDENPPRESRVENCAPGTPTEPMVTRRRGRDTEVSHTQTPLSRERAVSADPHGEDLDDEVDRIWLSVMEWEQELLWRYWNPQEWEKMSETRRGQLRRVLARVESATSHPLAEWQPAPAHLCGTRRMEPSQSKGSDDQPSRKPPPSHGALHGSNLRPRSSG
ncbi:unnamed protein product [Agarophyton chilense]